MLDTTSTASWAPYSEEEEIFRRTARTFFDRELDARLKEIDALGMIDAEFFRKAGKAGLRGISIPEEDGGSGASDICHVVLAHELGRSIGYASVGVVLIDDQATDALVHAGTA